jgi:hypothetical protein
MEIPFVGGSYTGRSSNINAQVCQNLYVELDQQEGKVPRALMNTPGLSLWARPAAGEVRGLHRMGVNLFAVVGSAVYRFTSVGTGNLMTGSLNSSTGPVCMKDNGTQMMITDGSDGYILSGTTLTTIIDVDYPIASFMTYQDGYFIVSIAKTGKFAISDSYDGTAWDALDFATKEAYPDNLQAVVSANRELWLLGKESYEVWYNSGDATFPFDRITGAVNKIGCAAPYSAVEYQGTLFWLDDGRQIRVNQGYGTAIASSPQIDYQFSQYTTVSDAIAFIYTQEGHTFYQITFPSHAKTWVYDLTTKYWHTRASGAADSRVRVNCHEFFSGMNIVGDFSNGNLYKYDLSKFSDNGTEIRRIRAAQVVHKDRKTLFHHGLEIEFEAGVGLAVADPSLGVGVTPQAMLDWSDDGGHTWSNEHWAYIGAIGAYKNRARWNRLGRSRERIYRVTVTDPVKCVILSAHLDATAGIS